MDSTLIITIIIAITVIAVVILWQGMSIAKTQMTVDQTEMYPTLP